MDKARYFKSGTQTDHGRLEFNVPFQHKYGYIRDETDHGK